MSDEQPEHYRERRRRRRAAARAPDDENPGEERRAGERAVLLGVLAFAVVLAWFVLEMVNGH